MPAPIIVSGFQGANYKIEPHQLNEQVGTQAVDIEPGRDRFVPINGALNVANVPAGRKAIYRLGRDSKSPALYWLSSSSEATYASVFGEDATEVTLIVGDGEPKWTNNAIVGSVAPYPQATRSLAVPQPTAPTASIGTDGPGTSREIYYIQTFVNDRGWESAPSSPSAVLTIKDGATVNLSNLGPVPSGNYGLTARRIYCTQQDTNSNAEFFFLREIPIASTSTVDDARERGALLQTYDGASGSAWLPPPATASAIIAMWNGMHAIIDGKKLMLCEPEAPYAWPERYTRGLKHTGVGLGKWGQNLVVLTTGEPVVYQGVEPSSLTPLPGLINQPCVSKRSIVSFPHGVAWASEDGLAWIGEGGQRVLTENIMTAQQWQAFLPSTQVCGRWRGFIVCSYGQGTRNGFMLHPDAPEKTFTLLTLGFDACHYDEYTQKLFVLTGAEIASFGDGQPLNASWTSKKFLQMHPTNYGFAKVTAETYPVNLTITAEWRDRVGGLNTNVESRTIENADAFTLQSGFLADSYKVRVQDSSDVIAIRLATRVEHLRG